MTRYEFAPIGFVRSPFVERAHAPRQPGPRRGARGRIEFVEGRGFEDALEGLEAWSHLWVLSVFHRNVEQERGWKPKVQPPRAKAKLGLFATRSPHRPNPLGMSAVRLEKVEGLVLFVAELDLLDGTPVLDIKPYVPYADAHPEAGSGWLEAPDPRGAWSVAIVDPAARQLAWLKDHGLDLRPRVEEVLALGPQPHAYRRIRRRSDGFELAIKDWRFDFSADGVEIVVRSVRTGYRPHQLARDPALVVHRSFVEAFPA